MARLRKFRYWQVSNYAGNIVFVHQVYNWVLGTYSTRLITMQMGWHLTQRIILSCKSYLISIKWLSLVPFLILMYILYALMSDIKHIYPILLLMPDPSSLAVLVFCLSSSKFVTTRRLSFFFVLEIESPGRLAR